MDIEAPEPGLGEEVEDLDGVELTHGELLRTHLLWNSSSLPNPDYSVACIGN